MRRILPFTLLLTLGAGVSIAPALAQDASGAATGATFADTLGLPEIAITASDSGYEGVPAATAAGRYVVSLTNQTTGEEEESQAIGFVRLPEGASVADLVPADAPSADEEPDPAAIAWLYEAYIAGGAAAEPGETGQAIVDLLPGEYVAWADDPASLADAPTLTVTGEMPADLATPDADITVTEVGTAEGYAFALDGELAPGPQVIAVVNKSDQPHFMELAQLPMPLTEEQLMGLMTMEENAPPPPDLADFDFEAIEMAAYAPSQPAGTTQWIAVDLQAGSHWIACWVPDPANEGLPHAMEGMLQLVTIENA